MPGVETWQTSFLRGGFYVNDTALESAQVLPLMTFGQETGVRLYQNLIRGTQAQSLWNGGDSPLNMYPMSGTIQMTVGKEEDYWLLMRATAEGRPQRIWFDLPLLDQWYVPAMTPGQTTWRTARRTPWGEVPGITHGTRPPRVYLDGVEQTVLTGGTPNAGEVVVPETAEVVDIETPALDPNTDQYLELRYHPQIRASLAVLNYTYAEHNVMLLTIELEEARAALTNPVLEDVV